ncbi:hypothetical protein [Telmatospirillum sp. J64-1]|uniref:hypothetical protein n=1 Tax=Telmatospirillum sp. J64-1 TaxID=2502183 RepID=UPI00115DFDC3|nr:hypothetical protein [Telmatospirillum sp. J64-1]
MAAIKKAIKRFVVRNATIAPKARVSAKATLEEMFPVYELPDGRKLKSVDKSVLRKAMAAAMAKTA